MTKHTIEITQEDIKNGKKQNCWRCPIALALKRKFPAKNLWVQEVFIEDKGSNNEEYDLPKDAICFISKFDNEETVLPFSFEIDLPFT